MKPNEPNEEADRPRRRHEASLINIGSDEAVGAREVMLTLVSGDLMYGCVDVQLLVVMSVGLAVM